MKGLVYTVVSGAVRYKGYFDWVLSRLVERDAKKEVRYLLWISFYQITHMKKAHYHVVMEAVEYAKRHLNVKTGSFVNAVLRRFIREKDLLSRSLPHDPAQALAITRSFPEWLVRRWLSRFGPVETDRLLDLLNEPPAFTIRIDPARASKADVVARLESLGVATKEGRFLDSALQVDKLAPVLKDPLFTEGAITVQDEASQIVARAVPPLQGPVLDACAGVGTKAAQIRESSPETLLVAMDNDMGRLRKTGGRMDRVQGDGLGAPYRKDAFGVIVLDAPCSSMGIIRKHPEIKWRRSEEEIITFGNYQLDLMRSLWDNLRAGGTMIYSVCSFEPEETVGVLDRFRAEKHFFVENPLPSLMSGDRCSLLPDKAGMGEDFFLSLPHETGMDGFFIARLRKP